MICYVRSLGTDWSKGTILSSSQKLELRVDGVEPVSLNFPKTFYDEGHILVSGLDDALVFRTFEIAFCEPEVRHVENHWTKSKVKPIGRGV
jgi:hypothetical protein